MQPNKKKVMLPHTMAKAGWNVLIGRDDIEAVGYDPYLTMAELQAALKDTDGIALSLTPLKAPEIAVAPRLRVAARIGVGYDLVDIPTLTTRGIPLMVVGTANSVSVAEHAIFMMYALAKQVMGQEKLVRENRWKDRWTAMPVDLAEKTLLVSASAASARARRSAASRWTCRCWSTIRTCRPRASRRRAASRSAISTRRWPRLTW